MRVAVVGATGNAGTALLWALSASPEITSVLGIARRVPGDTEPYPCADWACVDIGGPGGLFENDEEIVARLTELFAGVDAVVHLAWLIQPNHKRDALRRTNVDGTRRVALACARAGVRQLVVASSVGAYSPVEDSRPREETWPTRGTPTSHYSVDKAAQERVLDVVEAAHPGLTVTRIRPALIFQKDAGAEIGRYFLGPLVPRALLAPGRLPVVPLPRGLRLQVVHADDVAQAYVRAVLTGAGGAFNIASDAVLGVDELAALVGRGPHVEVPPALLRRALWAGWASRLVPTDPGWLDMGMGAPVMDTTRARTVLGWKPRRSAHGTLTEMLQGLAHRSDHASPPLRKG